MKKTLATLAILTICTQVTASEMTLPPSWQVPGLAPLCAALAAGALGAWLDDPASVKFRQSDLSPLPGLPVNGCRTILHVALRVLSEWCKVHLALAG